MEFRPKCPGLMGKTLQWIEEGSIGLPDRVGRALGTVEKPLICYLLRVD